MSINDRVFDGPKNPVEMLFEVARRDPSQLDELNDYFFGHFEDFFVVRIHFYASCICCEKKPLLAGRKATTGWSRGSFGLIEIPRKASRHPNHYLP